MPNAPADPAPVRADPAPAGTLLEGIRMVNAGQQGGGSWEGMNPDVVETQARILNGLSGEITALTDAWHGDDSRKFAAEWAGTHKPVFSTAATLLADMGDLSARSAAQQRTTSSS
jgi:uncharacterized protein YukE